MLIDRRTQAAQIQNRARVPHLLREPCRFFITHPLKANGHDPRGNLVIRDDLCCIALNEVADFFVRVLSAETLLANEFRWQKLHQYPDSARPSLIITTPELVPIRLAPAS